ALRLALGASRAQLLRAALLEAVLLAGLSGVAGLGLAAAGLRWLAHAANLPRMAQVQVGGWELGGAVLLALAAAMLFAAWPALLWARSDPQAALKAGSPALAGSGARAGRDALVAFEAAVTAMLLILTGLLLRSFIGLSHIQPGFAPAPKLVAAIDLAGPNARRRVFWDQLERRLQALPGVAAAGLSTELPLEGKGFTSNIFLEGDARPLAQRPIANFQFVSPGYFAAMGIALRGRAFRASDGQPGRPDVAIISATSAARIWEGQDPLGKSFRYSAPTAPAVEIVGVAADVRTELRQAAGPMVFQPYWDDLDRHLIYAVILPQPGVDPLALAPALRRAAANLEPAAAVAQLESMDEVQSQALALQHFQLLLVLGFGLGALLLAGLGIYSVVCYHVASSQRELGVRLALGANRRQLLAWVARRGLAPVGAGIVAGVAGALALGPLAASQLYQVRSSDPTTFAASVAVLLAAAAAACALPARRAARLDPSAILRG
ncbi:MAG: FtsX-like permease family protein, partial [Terriglobales bacterium]